MESRELIFVKRPVNNIHYGFGLLCSLKEMGWKTNLIPTCDIMVLNPNTKTVDTTDNTSLNIIELDTEEKINEIIKLVS